MTSTFTAKSDSFAGKKIGLLTTEDHKVFVNVSDLFNTLGIDFHGNLAQFRKINLLMPEHVLTTKTKGIVKKEQYISACGLMYILTFLQCEKVPLFIECEVRDLFTELKCPELYDLLAGTVDGIRAQKALKQVKNGGMIAKLCLFERASKALKSATGSLQGISNWSKMNQSEGDRAQIEEKISSLSKSVLDQFKSLQIDDDVEVLDSE